MGDHHDQPQRLREQPTPLPDVKHIVAVSSGKGGVGKSTVAANLAVSLALSGAKVGLIDADIYGPNIPMMLGSGPPPEQKDGKLLPTERYGVKLISMGFFVPEDTAIIWRGPMVHTAIQQFFRDVHWGKLDVLLIDLPPGTGDAQLSISQVVSLSGVIAVTTPQAVALHDVRKGITMFQKVNVPILGIVENMSYFICGHCGTRTDIFAHGGGKQAAEALGVPFLGSIPIDPAIRVGGDAGRPIVVADPNSLLAQAFRDIAAKISEALTQSSLGADVGSLVEKLKRSAKSV
jgi:ATP-binding protein involved in chromosome partitioning